MLILLVEEPAAECAGGPSPLHNEHGGRPALLAAWAAAAPRSRLLAVGVVVGEPGHVPLPAPRGQVQPPVGAEQRIQAALVGRIGVKHPVTLAHEDADPGAVGAGPDV